MKQTDAYTFNIMKRHAITINVECLIKMSKAVHLSLFLFNTDMQLILEI